MFFMLRIVSGDITYANVTELTMHEDHFKEGHELVSVHSHLFTYLWISVSDLMFQAAVR